MGKGKKSAQQAESSKEEKHAEAEGSRRLLADGEPESPPPRNDMPVSDALPEVTEELDSFNTANEKAPSEESDERTPGLGEEPSVKVPEADPQPQIGSTGAAIQDVPVTAKSPEEKDESALPLAIIEVEKELSEAESDSAKKVDDEPKDDAVTVDSESDEASQKERRKKRVLKRLGLRSGKQRKTGESSTPTQSQFLTPEDAAKSPYLAKEAGASPQLRSRRSGDKSAEPMPPLIKKRYDQFLKRKVLAERSVDLKEADQWGYLAVIKKGSMESTVSNLAVYVEQVVAEFYAGLPSTKAEADVDEVVVSVRGQEYKFSPAHLNNAIDWEPLTEEEEEEAATLDDISVTELASFITGDTKTEWDGLTTADLTPCYGALMIIAAYNWIPSTHKTYVSLERARLIYKMAHGVRVGLGKMMFRQILNLGVIQVNDARWLIFPRLIMALLQSQQAVPSYPSDKLQRPVLYKKDKRVGEIYEQRLAKGKGPAKAEPKRSSARTTRQASPAPIPAPRTATPSSRTAPRRVSLYELGSVAIPQGPLSRVDLQVALQDTTRALQALAEIVQDLQSAVAGGEEED
ncbi:uncharacterized protein LOC130511808 [Raphanus sativus]|uniref:Uncharacterized protein LOC130511808 n=1 Tax=Raphanus sativus TaxID=3726 RepID=A0A9W3DPL6_RAPSA|nr:uncharacterized protein LOC130511808 [Raphanus sativus]